MKDGGACFGHVFNGFEVPFTVEMIAQPLSLVYGDPVQIE